MWPPPPLMGRPGPIKYRPGDGAGLGGPGGDGSRDAARRLRGGRHPRAPRAAPAQRARPLGGLRGALDEPPRAPGGRAGGGREGAPAGRHGGAEPRRSGAGAAGA